MRKSDLLIAFLVVFVFSFGPRYAFADCLDTDDVHGSCRTSGPCQNPCDSLFDNGVEPLLMQVTPLPFGKPTLSSFDHSSSLGWLNLQGLIMYRRDPVLSQIVTFYYLDAHKDDLVAQSLLSRGRA